MKIYMRLIQELDSGGARYSESLSEVDLSDPEDVKITVADDDGAVVVHLGGENFLERFKTYIAHVQGWRQQFQKLSSVDLRYDKQVVVNPDSSAASTQPLTPAPEAQSAPVYLKTRAARYADAHSKPTAGKPATNAGQPGPWKTIVGPTPAPHAWRPHRSKRKAAHSRKTNSVR